MMGPLYSPEGQGVPWVERHAGLIVSLSVFTAFFSWSVSASVAMAVSIPAEISLEVEILAPEEPTIAELEPVQLPPELRFDEGAALHAASSPPQVPLQEWRPTTPQDVAALSEAADQLQDLRRQLEQERDALQAKIHFEETAASARDFKLSSDGAANGVVRTLDTQGFPDDIVRPLLARYGITTEVRHVAPSSDRRVFLSAASTGGGTFTNVKEPGIYEVFVMSAKAVSMLATMETRALMSKGGEPGRCRIRSITFGVIKDPQTDEFTLGVTSLEFDKL